MSSTDLQKALDDCLACLEQGDALDACLGRYPQYRARLEPLLATAQTLRARHLVLCPEEDSAALARIRTRVLAEASRRQANADSPARTSRFRPSLAWAQTGTFARTLVTLASIIVLLVGLFGGGSFVSANSLPGDPLYSIKRISEKVRLALAFTQEQRAQLEQQFEALRLSEIQEVVEQHREVEVDFAGPVESVEGNTITVQGILVHLVTDAQISVPPAVGTKVTVVANTQEDGSLEASLIAVATDESTADGEGDALTVTIPLPTQQPATHTPTAMPTEQVQPTDELPTEIPTPQPTARMIATARPTATRTDTLAPTATATSLPSATASPTATSTNTASPTPSATPAPTQAQPPREVKVLIEGTIGEIATQYWVIDGQRVVIRSTTRIDQTAAQAEVGGWAIAHAVIESDGQTVAQEIVVVRGPEKAPEPQEFSGVIESFNETQWTVAGQTVLISTTTTIEGSPTVGAVAHIQAAKYSDGRVVALSIQVETLEIVQFAGIIEEIQSDRWVVSGQVVLIKPSTQIDGTPIVGAIADIEAVAASDGTLTARRVRIDASTVQAEETP